MKVKPTEKSTTDTRFELPNFDTFWIIIYKMNLNFKNQNRNSLDWKSLYIWLIVEFDESSSDAASIH